MSNRAWVTLATNDSYGLGALVLAHSLRRAGSAYPAVILITPSVTEAMRDRLRAVFAEVVMVDVLDSKDATHLALLQRPELGITFTKIHCWSLTQYEKCVFLDADTLIVQNCDELFERDELSAAPDVGWPDCFNSGVFVFKPSAETFDNLVKFAQERGSFDGGDQGLLNSFFSDWAHGDINKHLPFLYNVTSAAFYSYIPALKHYGQNLKIIHFIGAAKPWLQQFNWETRTAEGPQHLREFLQLWWDIFVGDVHSVLDISMVEIEEALPAVPPPETFHMEPRLDYSHYEPILDPESEFPWHHPEAQIPDTYINVQEIDMTQYHDPWDIYRGHIPPNIDNSSQPHTETQRSDDHEELRKYAWDYMSPHQTDTSYQQTDNSYSQNVDVQNVWEQSFSQQSQFERLEPSQLDFRGNMWDYNAQRNYNTYDEQSHNNFFQHTPQYDHNKNENTNQYSLDYQESLYSQDNNDNHYIKNNDNHHINNNVDQSRFNDTLKFHNQNFSHTHNVSNFEFNFEKDLEKIHNPIHTQETRLEHAHYVHLDHENVSNKTEKTDFESKINGDGDADYELFETVRPRHPYDGFYLRHRMTIDSRGRKICTHEVPPTPTPTPPESPGPEDIWNMQSSENEQIKENGIEDQTGVAGNLARVVLGAGAQREALDDLTRRQGWEAGNIDYMGADAFDNIWAKISQTLSQPRTSPPKQSTPPPQTVEAPAPSAVIVAAPPVSEPPVTPVPAETPAPVSAPVAVPPEPLVATESPVPEQKSEAVKIEAPKVPESPQPAELPPAKVPEPVKSSDPVAAETAPTSTVGSVIAPVSTEVVAAVPTEQLEVAALAETPTAALPAVSKKIPDPSEAAESTPKELKPAEAKPAEPKPVEPKPDEPKPDEPKPAEPTPAKLKSAEPKPAEPKPGEPKPAEPKPAEPKPAEPKPAEPKPTESKPTESKLVESMSVASKPVELKPKVATITPPKVESAPAQAPSTTAAAPSTPVASKTEVTPEKGASTDSPPLANTPSKEDVPIVPVAKSEERRKPAGKLQLHPPAAADPLPTPDSELEDAAALAHAIIASEQVGAVHTPTVTSPSPSADPASPPPPLVEQRLSVEEPELPTPPVGAVSLSQIGVSPQPKPKATTAAQIESSVTEAVADAPKKKVVKKVLKKEGAAGSEAPVPPPRKKEKKPKDK